VALLPQAWRDTAWAMSEENVELVQSWLSRWNAGERSFADQIHPDAEILDRGLMEGRLLRGREGARRLFREIDEQFDEWTLTMEEWRDAGDYVVALGQVRMHGRESGITFDQPAGWLAEIRDGQIVRLENFLDDPKDALEAAGLSE
jgi:ketosteroid isomerase-like protein